MHIVKRNGVYQYQRRVPKAVIDRPAEFDSLFAGRVQFRRSLKTKNHTEALARAAEVEKEFEARVDKNYSDSGNNP